MSMKPFQPKAKKPSKLSQFTRICMLGLSAGVAVMILQIWIFSQSLSIIQGGEIPQPGKGNLILFQVVDWMDELLLAPATAYLAGRIFQGHRWKFIASMFIGIEIFPVAVALSDGLGVSYINMGFAITIAILGAAISLLTFKRGMKAGAAASQSPETMEKKDSVEVPMPLSKIDYAAIAKDLNGKQEGAPAAGSGTPAEGAPSTPAASIDPMSLEKGGAIPELANLSQTDFVQAAKELRAAETPEGQAAAPAVDGESGTGATEGTPVQEASADGTARLN